jgi:hypothetical protein
LKREAPTLGVEAGSALQPLLISVDAGDSPRQDTPVRLEVPASALPSGLMELLGKRSRGLAAREVLDGGRDGEAIRVQAEVIEAARGPSVQFTWILAGATPARARRQFRIESSVAEDSADRGPWQIALVPPGLLDVKNRDRTVFRYNKAPSSHPNYPPIQDRSAYIHPAFTPTGALITGDYSNFHPHHRGFFLAYTKTQVGNLHPDFWNIQGGSGKVHFDRLESSVEGPVTGRFVVHHRWEAKGGGVVLRERWDVELFDIPGQPYWLFDLTSTQQATSAPMELLPYRYGGMAYRGAEPFVKGGIDVLTSDGSGRRERDQKPARWVDLTGPIADGSKAFCGAMIADHPANPNHPTVARIHPLVLPFFSYVPSHDRQVTIGSESITVFRYRVLIHDGHPNGALDERVWRDFAHPPVAALVGS